MSRILVTGGAGFIGSHLVDTLVKKHKITILDNLSTGKRKYINKQARFVKMDIRNKKVGRLLKKGRFDYVYHLAAQKNLQYSKEYPVEDADINILGSLNVINAAKESNVKKIIFYSTAAVYNPDDKPPNKESDQPNPKTPYGVAKRVVEKYLEIFSVPYTVLRLSNVYGPRQDVEGEGGVVAVFLKKLVKDKQPSIYNNGRQTRDYIYVADVVNASLKILSKAKNESINISTNKETSVNHLFTLLSDITGKKIKPRRDIILNEQKRSALKNTRAKNILNWGELETLKQGLEKTYNWFNKENGK